jgi:hypothetical protein
MVLDKLFKSKVPELDKLDEVKPLTLNLCLTKVDGVIQAELRKRFAITEENKSFWIDFFEKSLSDIPIKVESQIVFRDKLKSKQTFKEFGLLNSGESAPIKKENKILDSFTKELNSDSIQNMAKNSKKWADEEFFK